MLALQAFGWPAVFEIYGSLGLFWMIAWQKLVSDSPPLTQQQRQGAQQQQHKQQVLQASAAAQQQQQQPSVADALQQPDSQQQQQQQLASITSLPRLRDIPWKSFFSNKAFLGIIMAHSAFGECYVVL